MSSVTSELIGQVSYSLATSAYDLLRNARLNYLYYGLQADKMGKLERTLQFVIALSAASAVGFAFGENSIIWKSLSIIAATASAWLAVSNLSKRVHDAESLAGDYSLLFAGAERLVSDIRLGTESADRLQYAYDTVMIQFAAVSKSEPPTQDNKLVAVLSERVNREFPPDGLWCLGPSDPRAKETSPVSAQTPQLR